MLLVSVEVAVGRWSVSWWSRDLRIYVGIVIDRLPEYIESYLISISPNAPASKINKFSIACAVLFHTGRCFYTTPTKAII